MKYIKVVTLCGSRKFAKEFRDTEIFFTNQGYAVLSPMFNDITNISDKELSILRETHLKKIRLSDEIFVIDVEGYIGENTKKEIEFAKDNNIKINYYSRTNLEK